MSAVKGMAGYSKAFLDDLQKEREDGNEIMIHSKTGLWSLTAIIALRDALTTLKIEDIPLEKSGKSKIRTWLKKRRAKK